MPLGDDEPYPLAELRWVHFGDVTGHGKPEALVAIDASGGGTQFWGSLYVFSCVRGNLRLLSWFTTGDRSDRGLINAFPERGNLVIELNDPDRATADCCSDGVLRQRCRWRLSNITISDFTFNGNGAVGSTTPNNLDIAASAGNIRIGNNIFKNAPLSSIALHPESGQTQPITGVTIENNMFFGSRRAPIHIDSGAFANKESKACDEMGNYDTEPRIVRNVTIRRNFFEGNHTGAFGLNGQNIWIQENLMINNYDSGSQDCAGGVVAVASCSRTVQVLRNHIYNAGIGFRTILCPEPGSTSNGRNPNQGTNMVMAGGLELWGRDIHVENNVVRYFPDEGIFAGSVKDLFVQNYNVIENTSRSFVNPPPNSTDPQSRNAADQSDRSAIRVLNKQVTCTCISSNPNDCNQACNCANTAVFFCQHLFRGTNGVTINQSNTVRNVGTRFQRFGIEFLYRDSEVFGNVTEAEANTYRNILIPSGANTLDPNRAGAFCYDFRNIFENSTTPPISAACPTH
ncbi:MAG: hypothetical protein U0Q16_03975 [Bryobacteraceae bacterium]